MRDRSNESVERLLAAAREELGMDVANVARFDDGRWVDEMDDGDSASFGISEGDAIPLERSICHRVVRGLAPEVIPDARSDADVRDLPVVADSAIGSYVGVPLTLSNGDVYGTLCCVSHDPDPALARRDISFMHVLARLLADQLERGAARRGRVGDDEGIR